MVSESEILILKEVKPPTECEANKDTKFSSEDEKILMEALEEQFNCVVSSSSSSSSESDDDSGNDEPLNNLTKNNVIVKKHPDTLSCNKVNVMPKPKNPMLDEK